MNRDQTFLGSGWGFPPEFSLNTKAVGMTTGEEDIKKSLEILLATRLGERVMLPQYGCNLEELLFQPLDLTLITYVKDLIKTAILYHEPRIDLTGIQINTENAVEGTLLINLDYIIRQTNSRGNMVFPFYKEEGSEI